MKTDPQKFELRRTIRARRDRVFAAWITPELVRRWFAPGAWSVTRATFDVRVGGGFEIGMRAPQAGDRGRLRQIRSRCHR